MPTGAHCNEKDDLPVSDQEKEAVDRGLAEIEANPTGGMSSEEFWTRIRTTPAR